MKWIIAITICLIFFVLSAPWVFANHLCSPHGAMIKQLMDRYNEQSIGAGQIWETYIVELFVSEERSTWTIISTGTDGLSCIIGAGQSWEIFEPRIKGKKT